MTDDPYALSDAEPGEGGSTRDPDDPGVLQFRAIEVGVTSLVAAFVSAILLGVILETVLGAHAFGWYTVSYALVGWWATRDLHHKLLDRMRSGAPFARRLRRPYEHLAYGAGIVFLAAIVLSAATHLHVVHGHLGWVATLSVLALLAATTANTWATLRTKTTSYTTAAAKLLNLAVAISDAVEHSKARQGPSARHPSNPPTGIARQHYNEDWSAKIRHGSLRDAQVVADRQGAQERRQLNAYQCDFPKCGGFHVGHVSTRH